MTALEALAVLVAGVGAGTINTVVGSGTLITFPVLLAVGYPPVTANVSNTVGLVPGGVSGVVGYRARLTDQRTAVRRLAPISVAGGITGAALLLALPASLFKAIVPAFIAIALVLIVFQPQLARWLERRSPRVERRGPGPVALAGVFGAGVYGGYFGAAQGILLLAILGLSMPDDLQNTNALKNVLATLVNAVAAVFFILLAHIEWAPAALIAGGSIVGAQLGARYGQRLHPTALKALIVVVGLTAIVRLVAL